MVKLGIVAWYEVNKNYVATVLCENRDKPELNCCGKCFVKKQLNKVDRNTGDKQAPGKIAKAETVEYVMPQTGVQRLLFFLQDDKVFNGRYTGSKGYEFSSSVFHPPPVT